MTRTQWQWLSMLFCALALAPASAPAQSARHATLKRVPPPPPTRPACDTPAPLPTAPTSAQRDRARGLAEAGRQAAISGDRTLALSQLRQAAALDPTNADLAYQLARDYETAGDRASAAKEYCRLLAVAPEVPEAAEVRDRIAALAPPRAASPSRASTLFAGGVAAYEHARMADAEAMFGNTIAAEPTWADAYYDRALARIATGDRSRAASDLETYLRLEPRADDRAQVRVWIESLRRSQPSAPLALGLGLIVPGGGQFYTRRPVHGALVAAGALAGIGFALEPHTKTTSVQKTATDPFGNSYTFTATRRTTDRPYLIPGLAAAGAFALTSAVEAFMFARNSGAEARRILVSAAPTPGGLTAQVSVSIR